MEIEQFKLIKNKQRPEFLYKYQLVDVDRRYVIFTMDAGSTFHAYIEDRNWSQPNTFHTVYESTFKSIDECLTFFNTTKK